MSGFLCTMVGASFTVAAAAEVLRSKKGITAIGNAQIDTAQSKFGGSSALFDGTDDALQITDVSWINWNSDFTVELWIRMSQYGEQVFFDTREGTGGNGTGGYLVRDSSSVLRFYLNGTSIVSKSDPNITTNTWYHVAITRSGNNFNMWIDGTSVSSATSSTTGTAYKFYIGRNSYSASSGNTVGHIDEFRFSNTARYTTNFTPSTTPFVNDDNTLLLIHANGTDASTFFEDDNGVRAPKSLIANGNAQIDTAQSKFGGSSALFDGTGDYLLSPSNSDFGFGTGDFTLEGWFRFVNFTNGPALFDLRAAGGTEVKPLIYCGADGVLYYYVNGAARITGSALSANTWYHITVSRASGSTKMFVNGTQVGSTYSDSNNYGTTVVSIGIASWNTAFNAFNGHADEIRISNTARYTANFTAPTQPFVNDTNTVLLIHCDGTDAATVFRDDNGTSQRVAKHISYYGNAQIDTAQSKFGGSSALFDGTGDYLVVQSNPLPTSGSFTVEFWIRFSSIGTLRPIWSNRDTGGTNRGVLYVNASGGLTWWNASDNLNFGSNLSANTWYHIACVKDGSTRRLFVDGGGMVTDSGAYTAGDLFQIGRADYTSTAFTSEIAGHIDEFRVSNTARYTANFTAPTAAFTNDANTLLLLHFNDADAATTFVDDNGGRASRGIVAFNNTQISTTQSKFGGSSIVYDGTDDYLRVYGLPSITGDATIEMWARFDILPWNQTIGGGSYMMMFATSVNLPYVLINRSGAGSQVNIQVGLPGDKYGSFTKSGVNLAIDTWYHIAIVRSSGVFKVFFNGTDLTTFVNDSGFTNSGRNENLAFEWFGRFTDSRGSWDGYMDEIRVSTVARYTVDFTPSTTPFQNDANTVLLIHGDGTNASTVFVDDNGRDTTPT